MKSYGCLQQLMASSKWWNIYLNITLKFSPSYVCMKSHNASITWLQFACSGMYMGIVQWQWTYNTHVKSDASWCFGCHISIHQHLTTILKSINYFHVIFRGCRDCVKMGVLSGSLQILQKSQKWTVLLHGIWSVWKSCENGSCSQVVWDSFRNCGKVFPQTKSRTKALCNL